MIERLHLHAIITMGRAPSTCNTMAHQQHFGSDLIDPPETKEKRISGCAGRCPIFVDQPNWRQWLCVPCAKHVWPVGRASCNQLTRGLHRHVQPLAGGGMPPHRRLIRKLAGQWPAPAQCIGQARGLLRHNAPAPAAVPEIGRPEACSGTRKTEHAKFCFQH